MENLLLRSMDIIIIPSFYAFVKRLLSVFAISKPSPCLPLLKIALNRLYNYNCKHYPHKQKRTVFTPFLLLFIPQYR